MKKQKLEVMVLMGGPSAEHEVSLHTGRQIVAHLDPKKYVAAPVTITKNGEWLLPGVPPQALTGVDKTDQADKMKKLVGSRQARTITDKTDRTNLIKLPEASALAKVVREKPDVVFIALHGKYGEDGTVQGLLESVDIPYTGSGVLASALGMNKPRSLSIFRDAGLLVPEFQVVYAEELRPRRTAFLRTLIERFSLPLVVKPSDQGSSVGVAIVKRSAEFPRAVKEAFKHSREIIIQKYIKGRELTCGILEGKDGKLIPLPPIEIVPRRGSFYDYESKYADGGSGHFIPPRGATPKMIRMVQDAAARAHQAIRGRGMSRSDFILGDDGKLYILEINTIPGMTTTSLLPQAAHAAGIDFSQLLDLLIQNALRNSH